MKNGTETDSRSATRPLYSNRFLQKTLHSRPASRLLSLVGPDRCGRIVGRILQSCAKRDDMNVLAVGRELFFKDTAQVEQRTGIHFIPWRSGHLGRLQQGWVPKHCQKQGHFFPAPHDREHACWNKGKSLVRAIHQTIEQKGAVPVIASANVDYWQEEVLRQYCTETGTPHLVLCRENISMPYYRNLVIERHRKYHFRFHGHVAVFSHNMKDLLIASGACTPEQITITGAPRMDIWLDARPAVEKDTVTLLSFRTNLFAEIFDPVFEEFLKIAQKHPEHRFVVKCKEGRDDTWARKIRKRPDLPSNLELECHTDLRTLLERSLTVIGVNSLAVVEALLTDATVIAPCWGKSSRDSGKVLMEPKDKELQQEIVFCNDIHELNTTIEQSLQSPEKPDPALRNRIVNRYMYFTPSETASQRVGDLITRLAQNGSEKA